MSNWEERLIMRNNCPPCFISFGNGCFYFDTYYGSLSNFLPIEESRLICRKLNDYYEGYMVRPVLRSEVKSHVLDFLQNEFAIFDVTIWVNGTNKPFQMSTGNSTLEELLSVYPSTYQTGTPMPVTSAALNRDKRNFEDYDVSYQTLPSYLPDEEIYFTLPKTEASTAMTTSLTPQTTMERGALGENLAPYFNATTICVLET